MISRQVFYITNQNFITIYWYWCCFNQNETLQVQGSYVAIYKKPTRKKREYCPERHSDVIESKV